jgi:hypothetical protein
MCGTQHVRLEQLRVPLADMLQGPTLNNMVCDIFNRQLAKHIDTPCSRAKFAHPLTPWLSPEPASGDSKGMPAKAHPADTLQLCKGDIRSSQVQGRLDKSRAHPPGTYVHSSIWSPGHWGWRGPTTSAACWASANPLSHRAGKACFTCFSMN